ncbi:proton channel OtopLc-like [Melitaea cinxia]|uniref:proton channel OtopLc-like n=1 Tax=Melitaea cinxia TaxID=113334 RepID=UPI001E270023|nr:proton channel OtopLc-like [Melitaea cinxia]
MANENEPRQEMLEEVVNRKNIGDKKFHSETSLEKFGENIEEEEEVTFRTKDPGILNSSVNASSSSPDEDNPGRRRTMSQPGPVAGNLLTAAAGRRRRPARSVMYADLDRTDSEDRLPKLILNKRDEYSYPMPMPTPLPMTDNPPSPFFSSNYRNGDIKSMNGYRLQPPSPFDMRGGTTPRKRSVVTMDAQSIRSVETQAPPPTSPEENARLSCKYFTLLSSCMYAVLLVTLGLIFYVADPFVDVELSSTYSLVLLAIGFLYHLYLFIDIGRYKTIALKNEKIKGIHNKKLQDFFRKQEEDFSNNNNTGDRTPQSIKSQALPPAVLIPLRHDYCFSYGRHSGSFYLKLGAAAFALGHLIHSVLLIAVQVSYYFDENIDNEICINIMSVVLDICSPLYCFLQLFFIFKYSNIHVMKAQGLAHFGFMHMIGSSLCFWIMTIIRETVLALTLYANTVYGNRTTENETTSFSYNTTKPLIDVSDLYNERCLGAPAITSIIDNFSPYLYPFAVEFNILIVAVYYIIWSHIGTCFNEDSESTTGSEDNQTICKIPTASEDNDYTSNIVIYADCHASNKGLFLGIILTVIMAGVLILGFVFSSVGGEFLELGYIINYYARLGLHSLMLIAVVIAYNQTRKLDINEHPISLLDDILLFICLPAFFMETVFSVVATVSVSNIVRSIDFVIMVIQVILQTPLLVDGLRRCSNTRKLRRTKPGREVLMFLLIANVAMWIFYTFSYKSPESLDERYEYYGKVLWSVLGHISLPLMMFYRFHSSVCFADMWDAAYKPGSDH